MSNPPLDDLSATHDYVAIHAGGKENGPIVGYMWTPNDQKIADGLQEVIKLPNYENIHQPTD